MKTHPHDLTLTPLARGDVLPLPGGRGRAVGVFSGRAWVTEQGDLEDHVLGPGESHRLARPGLAVVEALEDAQLILFETDEARRTARADHTARTSGTTLTVADYERLAHAMRRRAMADALRRLGHVLGADATKLWRRLARRTGLGGNSGSQGRAALHALTKTPTSPSMNAATNASAVAATRASTRAPAPMRRRWPGGPAPVWHAPR